MSVTMDVERLHLGRIWHVVGNPLGSDQPAACLRAEAHGALAVDGAGRIVALGEAARLRRDYPAAAVTDHGEALLLPGFVDAHLHFPQLDIIGSYGEQLIGWLNRYTFPTETRFADPVVASTTASRLVTELLANGTTTAMIFSSSHATATELLFAELERRGLRAITGKTSMDRLAPEGILQDPESDALDQEQLIARWHGRGGRLFYALSPRFAPVCSPELFAALAQLAQANPSLYVHTHYAEQIPEINWVRELWPQSRDYLDVYERFGLLGPRTLLAHVIHEEPGAWQRLAASGAIAAHCPTSNLFLGSGLCQVERLAELGVPVALGTDIGGGTSLSMWRTMDEAYKVQQLRGRAVHPVSWFYLATLGGARALGMQAETGNFEPGKSADFQVFEPAAIRLLDERFRRDLEPAELLFACIMLADDRAVRETWIGGRRVYERDRPVSGC